MENLTSKFENLSIEIFLEIFDYLSINDCFQAFFNLNWKINSALRLSGLSIDLTSISQEKYHHFYENLLFSNHSQQIRKLKISNELTIGLIDQFFSNHDLRDFPQLRSLTLVKPSYMTLSSLALFIPQLKQLEHISIDSNSYPENFFKKLTTKSLTIKSCYLPCLELHDEIDFQSHIEYLTITIEDITILLNLLAVFTKLKYLNVTLRSTLNIDENSFPSINMISCENLQILKINLLERSFIDLNEIEYFLQHTQFFQLKTFSYNSIINSLNDLNVTRWNNIFTNSLSTIKNFNCFIQIPLNLYPYTDIKQILNQLQINFSYSFSLSINSLYYIIHTDIYPKKCFYLPRKLVTTEEEDLNSDPIHCNQIEKFSKMNSLIIDSQSISSCTTIPKNIQYLQIQGKNTNYTYEKCLKDCSNQLLELKIFGLPKDLPHMPKLRQLMIQQVMFDLNMVERLASLCPRLELITFEIDCIEQFEQILNHLRDQSKLRELKFIRAFSRDPNPNQTWSSWLNKNTQTINDITCEAKNSFLFIWL